VSHIALDFRYSEGRSDRVGERIKVKRNGSAREDLSHDFD
jgi:hypothetical protein